MPGIVLAYNKNLNDISVQNIGSDIAERMYNCESFQSIDVNSNNIIHIKLMRRNNNYSGVSKSGEGLVAWFGNPLYKGNPLNGDVFRSIKETICKKGINALIDDISGHFQLVVYLQENRACYVVCDKISSYPVYYVETEDFIVFTPEPLSLKALKKYNWHPTIRRESVFEFMASGHLWGDKYFWKEVKRLGPGQFIWLDSIGNYINSCNFKLWYNCL